MIKRLPSRNYKSKGIKVKHVLQIILLLGVCFWLIYQIKHSRDKKKEFAENDAKLSVRTQAADRILKLGRKDLHLGKTKVNQNEKHEEEEEDENIVEDEENKHEHNEQEEDGNQHETEEKKDNKHEVEELEEEEKKDGAEEQEEEENKSEEMEDEGRGGGDDEIDENDQEKSGVDTDRDEEFMDEEKDKEEVDEKENEDSKDEERGGLIENRNTHEAREEHYKGDDASSAVAHDTHTTNTESETFSLEKPDANSEMSISKPENETNYSDESNRKQNDSDFKVTEGELKGGTFSNVTDNSLSNPLDSSHLNKTAATNSDIHLEASSNLTLVITEASNNVTGTGAESADTSSSSKQNNMAIFSESNHAQNTMANTTVTGDVKNVPTEGLEKSGNRVSKENLPESDSTASVKTANRDGAAGESSNLGEAGELEKTMRYVASNETENNSRNLDRKDSTDASEHENSKGNSETSETQNNSYTTENTGNTEDDKSKSDTQTGETHAKTDSSSANGTSYLVEHDATDSSDSHIHKDVTVIPTDLDKLPDIRNKKDDGEEIAAE